MRKIALGAALIAALSAGIAEAKPVAPDAKKYAIHAYFAGQQIGRVYAAVGVCGENTATPTYAATASAQAVAGAMWKANRKDFEKGLDYGAEDFRQAVKINAYIACEHIYVLFGPEGVGIKDLIEIDDEEPSEGKETD